MHKSRFESVRKKPQLNVYGMSADEKSFLTFHLMKMPSGGGTRAPESGYP
jgi:hypothetical protein